MNERIKKLAEQADAYADAMDGSGKNYIGLRDNYFAKLIVKECAELAEECYCGDTVKWMLLTRFGVEP